jgi:hypothetical protein
MYLLRPSDLSNVLQQHEQSGGAIPSAPPLGSEGMLKTRLGELDSRMQNILQSPTRDMHQKIRLYLEALRQYIMGARHLDRVLQHDPPSTLRVLDRESQTEQEEKEVRPAKRRRDASTSTIDPVEVVDNPLVAEDVDVAPVEQEAVKPTKAAIAIAKPQPVEREIRPARFSFYEIAEQATQPYGVEALLDLMPPSKKDDARKILTDISKSTTMRWDPATGHVYRGDDRISGSLIDKFLQKRLGTTQASKGPMVGYDDFMTSLAEARASQRPSTAAQVGKGRKNSIWLRY